VARKRTRIDIIGDMLSSIQNKGGRIKPTHLMYSSNLSHIQMSSYLEELTEKSFIQKIKNKENNDYILITDTGSKFLEKLHEMKEFEKTFGL
jgi:predicted transcriptional regulator